MEKKAVVLFDGVCNLCNGFVNFLIDKDPQGRIIFGALQHGEGQELAKRFGIDGELRTVALIMGDTYDTKSTAIIHILSLLGFPWNLVRIFFVLPHFIRNSIYDFVVRHRYHWFGKRKTCRAPTKENKERFLK